MKKKIWNFVIGTSVLMIAFAALGLLQSASMSETPNSEGSVGSFYFWLIVLVSGIGSGLVGSIAIYNLRSKADS